MSLICCILTAKRLTVICSIQHAIQLVCSLDLGHSAEIHSCAAHLITMLTITV